MSLFFSSFVGILSFLSFMLRLEITYPYLSLLFLSQLLLGVIQSALFHLSPPPKKSIMFTYLSFFFFSLVGLIQSPLSAAVSLSEDNKV